MDSIVFKKHTLKCVVCLMNHKSVPRSQTFVRDAVTVLNGQATCELHMEFLATTAANQGAVFLSYQDALQVYDKD